MRCRYLDQDSDQTLQQALEEYFATIRGLITADNAPADVASLFRLHDIGHVVFGCDTTMNGEPLADTWCMLGTTVTLREYARYAQLPEARAIMREIGLVRSVIDTVRSVPNVCRVIWRARHMRKKWDYWHPELHMDRRLRDIREEHGIRVVTH